GYWIYVYDLGLTLQFPPVFLEGANVGGFVTPSVAKAQALSRSVATPFAQSKAQYRLMISARTPKELDDQNFVGKADSAADASLLKILEPPMGPRQNLALSIASDKPGETRLAQSLLNTTGPMKWTVYVQTNTADKVTVTWPNMSTVPKNVNFRLTDTATGTTRDMRRTSGYTFDAMASSTRSFTIEATQGTVAKATIGNVVISQAGKSRDKNAPFTISYTLSASATTTVRILGAGGREIYTATRGRADVAGENTATWALRDNANRAVAPGIYRVEITAETADGERVRKIVPVTVIR
ncbi:MAG: FlgD immunoglobulin-like domain containing protein, partial [Armatimonadota bacterium]